MPSLDLAPLHPLRLGADGIGILPTTAILQDWKRLDYHKQLHFMTNGRRKYVTRVIFIRKLVVWLGCITSDRTFVQILSKLKKPEKTNGVFLKMIQQLHYGQLPVCWKATELKRRIN